MGPRGALLFVMAVVASCGIEATAQTPDPANSGPVPGVIVQGSGDVFIGRTPAARQGDQTTSANPLIEGSPNVFVGGRPAATVGHRTDCGAVVVSGGSNVLINGKSAARLGDSASGCLPN